MKISYLIFFSFLFILLLFSFTTYINFKQSDEVRENSQWVDESTTIIRNSNRFQRNILNMISGLRGYLFTGENYFIQAYDSAKTENETILAELASLIPPDNESQRTLLGEIRTINDDWLENFSMPLIAAKKTGGEFRQQSGKFQQVVPGETHDGYRTIPESPAAGKNPCVYQ